MAAAFAKEPCGAGPSAWSGPAVSRVQKQRRVEDRPGQEPVHRHPLPGTDPRVDRHPAALWLEPEQRAVGGRVADRAGAVGCRRGGGEARGDGGAAAAGRSARGPGGVPRVAGHAPGGRLGEHRERELGEIGLADHDGARGAQPPDQLRVVRGRLVHAPGPVSGQLPRHVVVVLHRDRDPEQRRVVPGGPAPLRLLRLSARPLREHHPKGVQARFQAFDSLQVQLDELARGDLPGANELGLPGYPGEGDVRLRHGGHSIRAGWSGSAAALERRQQQDRGGRVVQGRLGRHVVGAAILIAGEGGVVRVVDLEALAPDLADRRRAADHGAPRQGIAEDRCPVMGMDRAPGP